MHRRNRWRRALPFLILLVLAVAAYAITSQNVIRQQESARWTAHYLDIAELIAAEAQGFFSSLGETEPLNDIANQFSETLGISVTFLTMDGAILGSSSPVDQLPPPPDVEIFEQAVAEGQAARMMNQDVSTAVVVNGEDGRPLGIVYLQAPSASFRIDFNQLWNLGAIIILVLSIILIIVVMVMHDYSLKPVETLTIAAQQMSSGNFHNLDFPVAPQELSGLSEALQQMARQLGDQIDALTSERTKLSAVLNQMTDGVMIADTDGRVQLLNPAAERLFQIDAKKGLGRSVVEVLRYHQLVDLWRAAKEGRRQITMLEIGPQHLFLQVTGMPLKTSLKGSTLILFQDLTQLRRLETVRRDFISNVSHELRTPLASLKALAETLQEGALDDPPAAQRFLIRMQTEIDNLTQLVNELLELSRIESGKMPLSFQRIQPCDLLRPAYERMGLQVERAGLTLLMDCQPDLPAVFADPDRITQVMINLVHNATKFTPPGGQITLSAYRDGDFVIIFVKDTGVGIPKKDLSRIFERFYKADRARAGGGTGLGLSIAKHMVESHGGFIWAESEEDLGSTFYFSLPIA